VVDKNNQQSGGIGQKISRRETLRKTGIITTGGLAITSGVAAGHGSDQQEGSSNRSKEPSNGKIIYADEHGRIVRTSSISYVIRGPRSRKDYDFLDAKLDEILNERPRRKGRRGFDA
jgi:hypothetical protein